MNSVVGTFMVALAVSLALTPVARKLARSWRIVDEPTARKVHAEVTPRAGGVAIYVAFMLAFLAALVWEAEALQDIALTRKTLALLVGGSVAFGLGLWDDVRSLAPTRKLVGQVMVALIAYLGGIEIVKVTAPGFEQVALGWVAAPATIVWFVLIINALNLIDGLDGLATGIALFTALILLVVLDTSSRFLVAVGLAALAGACLGFLRHNFHPATIFLGDGGSYFLGFNLAALSIMGSVKSEATVAILIPVIALGVPVIDALWSPVRRFILGQPLFHPDRDHIHHRLLKLGYTHRRAVLLLYGVTILMGLVALALVQARDDRAVLILAVVAAGTLLGIRKLGYLTYIHRARLVGWFGTVSDELGLRRNRRSFLECQVSISQSANRAELQRAVAAAAQFLALDHCELRIADTTDGATDGLDPRGLGVADDHASTWDPGRTLHLSLPLVHQGVPIGRLRIAQQGRDGLANPYLLRRIDQLRGTIAETLYRLEHGVPLAEGDTSAAAGSGTWPGRGRRPRVLFLTHYFPPEGNAPAARVHALSKCWLRHGHDVTVLTCTPNVPSGIPYEGYANKLYQREAVDGIDTIRVWTYLAANKGMGRRILNYLSYMVTAVVAAVFTKRPDVIIATSPQFFCGWAGVLASRLRGVPFVLEIRDIWPASIVTVGAMRNRRLVQCLEWLEHQLYAAADHIVTVGEGYRDELRKKNVPAEKMTVIPNGVDRELFAPRQPEPQIRARWSLGSRFVCAYVGTVGMACGLDVLLRAGRLLQTRGRSDIRFLVVGDGAAQAELAHEAERAGLDTVIFTGRQSKDAIPALLSSVDACLVHLKKRPLFTTVMPSKIFEAAAMAKPIILGVQGHAADLVERAGCGICIEPENEVELVAAVERLADDQLLATALGRRGHDYFVERFDREVLARKYLDVIRRIGAQALERPDGGDDRPRRATGPRPQPREASTVPPGLQSADLEPSIAGPTSVEASS